MAVIKRAERFQISVVAAAVRAAAPQRVGAEGQGARLLPQGQLQGDVPHHRELPVLGGQPPQAADALDEGALHRGREAAGAPPGGRRKVPNPQKVPAAADHLGRRGDLLLLQGEVQTGERG